MEPLRPSDYDDGSDRAVAPVSPSLGTAGWARFLWRQLTSMKTALFLLLLLALGAIPGSLVPQRSADPNGVVQFERDNPELFAALDALQLFDTYTSVWFSAIYILLFISLVGCIIPRTAHHIRALRTPPPKTPKNLSRLEGFQTFQLQAAGGERLGVDEALAAAEDVLRKSGYRIQRYGLSVAGEKGYLRETANLVFHFALVGVLVGLGAGVGFKYSGQKVLVEGTSFTNQLASYDSFTSGPFVDTAALTPFGLRLESFAAEYEFDTSTGFAQPLDFAASVEVIRDGKSEDHSIRVNEPLDYEDTSVYLLGNGFAPHVTVRDSSGQVVYSQPVVFLPQDSNLTSLGVIKIPDGLDEQVGMIGFFYPSAVALESGALASVYPDPDQPVMTMNVFTGDLGLDEGIPRNVYALETEQMTQVAGGEADAPPLVLGLGQTVDLPNGLGSLSFEELPRFVSVDVHRDPTQLPVAFSAAFIVAGLVTSLFVVRRRAWVRLEEGADGAISAQVAGLSRGDDPSLEESMAALARDISQAWKFRLNP